MFENPVLMIVLIALAAIGITLYAAVSNRKAKQGSVLYAVMSNGSSTYGIKTERWLLAYRSRRGNIRHNGKRFRLCADAGIRRGKPTVSVTARDGRTIFHRRSRQNLTVFPPDTALEMV